MQIEWADSARQDFDRAIAFLQQHSPAGARRVGLCILDAVSLLEHFPKRAPPSRHRALRQLVVPRTAFLVVYRVNDGKVEIRAIVHAGQKRRK